MSNTTAGQSDYHRVPEADTDDELPLGQQALSRRQSDVSNPPRSPTVSLMSIHATSTSASLSQADPEQEKTDTHGGTPRSATYLTPRGDLRLSWFQRQQYWASQQWFYEISACVLTALSLVGIATLLAIYDRRPTPEWPRIITINSAISILTTILKGTMMFTVSSGLSQLKWTWFLEPRRLDTLSMFDEASRGPWGATIFLFGRVKSMIALAGALITIVAVAIDPFAQQVVSYELCPQRDAESRALLTRAQGFDSIPADFSQILQRSLVSNLYRLNDALLPQINVSCSSGNCTFDGRDGSYSYLGISHWCEDITSTIVNTSTWAVDEVSGPYTYNNYSLPGSSLNIVTPLWKDIRAFDVGQKAYADLNISFFTFEAIFFTRTPTQSQLYDVPVIAEMRNIINETVAELYYRRPEEPMAIRCGFRPTIKTVNVTINSNRLTQHETSVEHLQLTDRGAGTARGFTIDPSYIVVNGSLILPGPPIDSSSTPIGNVFAKDTVSAVRRHRKSIRDQSRRPMQPEAGIIIDDYGYTYMKSVERVLKSGQWKNCTISKTEPDEVHSVPVSKEGSYADIDNPTDWTFYEPGCFFYMDIAADRDITPYLRSLLLPDVQIKIPATLPDPRKKQYNWVVEPSISNIH